ncbi:MAG: hypothetical protein PVSMB1_05290 [Gemmatimonadaceae bacterium]
MKLAADSSVEAQMTVAIDELRRKTRYAGFLYVRCNYPTLRYLTFRLAIENFG